MRRFKFDSQAPTPFVSALLVGPTANRKVRLVFDTGAALTQIHRNTMTSVGYSENSKIADCICSSVHGEPEEGYLVEASKLFVLGSKASDVPIGVFYMDNLEQDGIDGLLGWDLIRQFHLEMDGPMGFLKIYD